MVQRAETGDVHNVVYMFSVIGDFFNFILLSLLGLFFCFLGVRTIGT